MTARGSRFRDGAAPVAGCGQGINVMMNVGGLVVLRKGRMLAAAATLIVSAAEIKALL